MKKIAISLGSVASLGLPLFVFADSNLDGYLGNMISQASRLLSQILVFLIALAVVWFIWNTIQYTISDDEDKKGKAKQQMIWGIVGIAVIVSVWGLVEILRNAFGVDSGQGAPNLDNMIPGSGYSSNPNAQFEDYNGEDVNFGND